MYNIVTFNCVDESNDDKNIQYDQWGAVPSEIRRISYWKNIYTLCCSSVRINDKQNHIVFTNDNKDVIVNGINIRENLNQLGVEIRYLPFEYFNPTEYSPRFKNAFYKFEVMKALGEDNIPSIILDTDCLWVKKIENIDPILNSDKLMLYDVYERINSPDDPGPHKVSINDTYNCYKNINLDYPNKFPIWYGGEFLGASSKVMKETSHEIKNIFDFLIEQAKINKKFYLSNGKDLLSGNEMISSYVFNNGKYEIVKANEYIKRMWTYPDVNNVSVDDLKYPIWHLISEKRTGLKLLFKQAINHKSKFWTINPENLPQYFGEYCGIPKRKYGRFNPFFIKRSINKYLKR